jgi:hypothetical protein
MDSSSDKCGTEHPKACQPDDLRETALSMSDRMGKVHGDSS